MRRRVEQLVGEEIVLAKAQLYEWGYPRPVDDHELVLGSWFRWGEDGIFFIGSHEGDPSERHVHVCRRPGTKEALRAFEWQRVLLVLGDLLGVERFLVRPLGTKLGPLLTRLGWTEEAGRWYLSLGEPGGVRGEGKQAAARGPDAPPAREHPAGARRRPA